MKLDLWDNHGGRLLVTWCRAYDHAPWNKLLTRQDLSSAVGFIEEIHRWGECRRLKGPQLINELLLILIRLWLRDQSIFTIAQCLGGAGRLRAPVNITFEGMRNGSLW